MCARNFQWLKDHWKNGAKVEQQKIHKHGKIKNKQVQFQNT
jgi:hypothetical protein